jgi:hypothetical protein
MVSDPFTVMLVAETRVPSNIAARHNPSRPMKSLFMFQKERQPGFGPIAGMRRSGDIVRRNVITTPARKEVHRPVTPPRPPRHPAGLVTES